MQKIEIKNTPLTLIIVINLCMPTHQEDIILIPLIQEAISETIITHLAQNIIMMGDFNKDIKLIWRHQNNTWHPPNTYDKN
jgi:hypothetical protein